MNPRVSWFLVGVLSAGAVAAGWLNAPPAEREQESAKVVRIERLEIVGADGSPLAFLGVSEDGSTMLTLTGKTPGSVASLAVKPSGGVAFSLSITTQYGKTGLSFEGLPSGRQTLNLIDKQGAKGIELRVNEMCSPTLELSDVSGTARILATALPGTPLLSLERDKKIVFRAP